jgi:hypothetical protein
MDSPRQSARIRTTITGGRGSTPERASFYWSLKDALYWGGRVDEELVVAPYCGMSWEHYRTLVCHDLKKPLREAWLEFKPWN